MLILCSASPRRYEILVPYFTKIEVVVSHCDESRVLGSSIDEHLRDVSERKLNAVYQEYSDKTGCFVSADTLVILEGNILEKPKTKEENLYFLRCLNGKKHTVKTAYTVRYQGEVITKLVSSDVIFHYHSDELLNAYVNTGEGLDKAGGYGIQGIGKFLVDRIEGDFYSIMGFPISDFIQLIETKSWNLVLGCKL